MEANRILLIEPPFYRLYKDTYSLDRYPLSLGYLAGIVKKETTWDVMVYNADFTPQHELIKLSYWTGEGFQNYLHDLKDLSRDVWEEVKSTILEYKPSVVGISATSQNFTSACVVAKLAKEASNQIVVIVGGPHPSMVGKEVLNCPDIDVGVKGEGEKTLVELLHAIKSGKGFDRIRGIVYRKERRLVENPPREFIEDLDSLPFPHENAPEVLKDYDLYPITAFRNIFAVRGCPYNCFFCGSRKIWSRRVRFRSPENVVSEIKGLQRMGLRLIHFDDDTFGISKEYIRNLCNAIIENCPEIKWSCELHAKLADEATISLMKAAGCHSIDLGIESGNNEILKAMRKQITIEEALVACDLIKKHGIELKSFFIVGFPQETEETLNDTLEAMKKTRSDVLIYSVFTPYPGTEAFEFCREKGLIDDDYDVSLYNHQSPANCFCINIPRERFRELTSRIERVIDRRNSINRVKRIFFSTTFKRIQELGFAKSLKKGLQILTGR